MTLFNIISCALISAAIGRGYPRWLAITVFIAVLILQPNATYGYITGWLYAFTIIRLFPTGGLFQAISNEPPINDGSKVESAIYQLTMRLWRLLPDSIMSWKLWSIIYGFIRTLPVIPAAYYLNAPLLYLMPFIGVIYCACGKVFCGRTGDVLKDNTRAVIAAEIVTLGIMGASL